VPDNEESYGELVDLDGRRAVRFVRRYAVSRAELWSAITERERTARWAFPAEMEPRSGGALRFDYGEAGSVDGTILVWDEPSVLEYEWGEAEMPWRIRFELASDGDEATLLTFDHFLPDPSNPDFAAGWHWHLDRLAQHLAGTEPPQVDSDEHFEALQGAYGTRFAGA